MAIKKGPTKVSGGKHRNKLKGYGPTPKAEDRVYHKAYKAKKAAELLGENKMDVSKAQAQFKEFEQAADGLNAYAKQADAKLPMMWTMFEDQVEQFRIAAKQRLRAVRDNQPPESATGEGSSDHMLETYNELVQGSNQLQ